MKRRLLLSGILLFVSLCTCPADSPSASSPPVTDAALVSAHYCEVVARPEYQDTGEANLSSRFKDSLSEWFLRLGSRFGKFQYSGEMPAVASLLMTLLVIFCVAGLLYVMIRLTRRRDDMQFDSSPGNASPRIFRTPESYDDEIEQAVQAGNWHDAWLAGWRQFLSRLENRHLVEADRTRTNREYLTQLRAKALPAPAIDLLVGMVEVYDQTIYGRKPIAEPDWNQFQRQIVEAGLLLNLEEKIAPVRTTGSAL